VGLRLPHLAAVAVDARACEWLEIHPENFLANPHARELLLEIAAQRALSVHTVGISVGSAGGIDREHLSRLKRLIDDVDPILVSGHLAWSTHGAAYLNDLLPLPYDEETLAIVAAHVDEVQHKLGRPFLVENPASYVGFATSTRAETEFLGELVRITGCRLLCDVSNIHVSAANLGFDAYDYVAALPAEAVDEIHLGGFTPEPDDATPGGQVLIDTHAAPIAAPVWDLYRYAVQRFGCRPTLIEWDANLPAFAQLLAEASRANDAAAAAWSTPRRINGAAAR
jgi:uncharacterized protein (UPF0276 family)